MLRITRPLISGAINRNLKLASVRAEATAPPPPGKPKKPALRPEFEKMRKLQEHFQKKDGLPVFLKNGGMDQVLYRTTMALAVIGLILDIQLYIVLAMP